MNQQITRDAKWGLHLENIVFWRSWGAVPKFGHRGKGIRSLFSRKTPSEVSQRAAHCPPGQTGRLGQRVVALVAADVQRHHGAGPPARGGGAQERPLPDGVPASPRPAGLAAPPRATSAPVRPGGADTKTETEAAETAANIRG